MIKKIFIKDYEKTNDNHVRKKYGITAGIFGIITSAFVGFLKLIIGLLSNSVSIIADASNNIIDMASSILNIVGFKLSNKSPTTKYPYGYARFEYIAGFIISIIMIIMSIIFIKESIVKIINPQKLIINNMTFIILIIAIIVKYIQMITYYDFAFSIQSKALKATAVESKNDIISSISIFLSLIIMKICNINLDGIIGLFVSIIIFLSSINMMKEVISPLIGVSPDISKVNKIKKILYSYDFVKEIHSLIIHDYGINKLFVTVHVKINDNINIKDGITLLKCIENDFKEKYNVNLTIHLETINDNNLINLISKEIKILDKDLIVHDFIILENNIKFICIIPYEKNINKMDIEKYLYNKINKKEEKYNLDIEIDRPYC